METIGAIVLAAGNSARLGQAKQLLQFRGQTLLRRSIAAAREANCSPIAVVMGAECERMGSELVDDKVLLVENPNWERGIGNSIRTSLRKSLGAYPNLDAVILLASDQPLVDRETILRLKTERQETKKPIVAPLYANTLGIPALFASDYFDQLLALEDEAGAKRIIVDHLKDVAQFPFPAGAFDIDTADDYERLVRQYEQSAPTEKSAE